MNDITRKFEEDFDKVFGEEDRSSSVQLPKNSVISKATFRMGPDGNGSFRLKISPPEKKR